jgi:hypothetical protein
LKIINSAGFKIPLFSVKLELLNSNGVAFFDEFSVYKCEEIEYFMPNSMNNITFNFRFSRSAPFNVRVVILYNDLDPFDGENKIFPNKSKSTNVRQKWTAEIDCFLIHFPLSAFIKPYGDSKFATLRYFYCKDQITSYSGIPKEIFTDQWERLVFGACHNFIIGCIIIFFRNYKKINDTYKEIWTFQPTAMSFAMHLYIILIVLMLLYCK